MSTIDFMTSDAPKNIIADVCIVGAGPAGITLAMQLASENRRVALLEAGDVNPSIESQSMYAGTSTGIDYFPLDATRLRAFGGSSGHWSGWCGPLNPLDFQERPWIPNSGWPIDYTDLRPYYDDAQRYTQLGDFAYSSDHWQSLYDSFPEFETNNLLARFWQFSTPPLNFGTAYTKQLEDHEFITVYKNANVTEINLNGQGDKVESLTVKSLSGNEATAIASHTVIACGGLENPRLLLASRTINKAGVGNDRDVVGRYFMEHPEVEVAKLSGFNALQMSKLKRLTTPDQQTIGVAFCAGTEQQTIQQMGNGATFIAAPSLSNVNNGWASLLALRDGLAAKQIPENAGAHIKKLIADFDSAIGIAALRMRGKETSTQIVQRGFINVICMCEQSPNPNSRVSLSEQTDLLGSPQVNLHWDLTELDRHTIRATVTLMAAEFNRLGLGTIQLDEWLRKENTSTWPERLRGGHHHMGTTRMSADPAKGVVDKNCTVHGIDNLHIAGSSVFPTGGYVNPTLTIVALASRLADHLKSKLL